MDLIERQAAIDALDELCDRECPYTKKQRSAMCGACALGSAFDVIDELPADDIAERLWEDTYKRGTADARGWIPVSERLPKIDMSYPHHEDYLVQYDSGDMDVASWSNVNRFWTDHVTEPHWNCVQFAEVIAWMPLPEPWKGEEDETD